MGAATAVLLTGCGQTVADQPAAVVTVTVPASEAIPAAGQGSSGKAEASSGERAIDFTSFAASTSSVTAIRSWIDQEYGCDANLSGEEEGLDIRGAVTMEGCVTPQYIEADEEYAVYTTTYVVLGSSMSGMEDQFWSEFDQSDTAIYGAPYTYGDTWMVQSEIPGMIEGIAEAMGTLVK